MNILILTPRMPFPPFRGDKLKIYNIAKNLSESNKVTILTFVQNEDEQKGIDEYAQLGIKVVTVKQTFLKSLLNCFVYGLSGKPFQQLYYKSKLFQSRLDHILNNEKFDVMYYHLIRMAQYDQTEIHPEILHISDYTDAVSLYLMRLNEVESNPIKKILFKEEAGRVRKAEVINKKFDLSFVCSDSDRTYLTDYSHHPDIKILPNGIELRQFKPDSAISKEDRFLFTGNMPYFPNIDAALYFAKDIFPALSEKYPSFRFYIVGQDPPKKIRDLAGEKIVVTGFVQDIRAEYLKSKISVAPMRFGAGTLNKIIESMALGTPVIASTQAVSGMSPELRNYVFTADTPLEYVKQADIILSDYGNVLNKQREGINYITSHLSWEKIVTDFEKEILSGIQRKTNSHL